VVVRHKEKWCSRRTPSSSPNPWPSYALRSGTVRRRIWRRWCNWRLIWTWRLLPIQWPRRRNLLKQTIDRFRQWSAIWYNSVASVLPRHAVYICNLPHQSPTQAVLLNNQYLAISLIQFEIFLINSRYLELIRNISKYWLFSKRLAIDRLNAHFRFGCHQLAEASIWST